MERRPLADEKEMQHEEEMQREEELRDEGTAAEGSADRPTEETAGATDAGDAASDGRDLPPPREEVPPVRDAPPSPDEQLTVPEDRDAAAMAEGRQPSVMPQRERDAFEVFSEGDLDAYRRRWDTLQASFVDDPRTATEQAGALAGELVRRLSERYETLRSEFAGGSEQDADTEVMRHTIRRYRSIFRAVVG